MPGNIHDRVIELRRRRLAADPLLEIVAIVHLCTEMVFRPPRMTRRELGEACVRHLVAVDAKRAERHGVSGRFVVERARKVDAIAAAQFGERGSRCSHAECAAGHEHAIVARRGVGAGCRDEGKDARGKPHRVSRSICLTHFFAWAALKLDWMMQTANRLPGRSARSRLMRARHPQSLNSL